MVRSEGEWSEGAVPGRPNRDGADRTLRAADGKPLELRTLWSPRDGTVPGRDLGDPTLRPPGNMGAGAL